ncbi:MAG: hypothetical protein HY000_00265 [Planctomycetes bacterium]|nr:hypothetical protein [Planctomycetota bacterium]
MSRRSRISRWFSPRSWLPKRSGRGRNRRPDLEQLEYRLAPSCLGNPDNRFQEVLHEVTAGELAEAIGAGLARLRSALDAGANNVNLPVIGDQLRDGMRAIADKIAEAESSFQDNVQTVYDAINSDPNTDGIQLIQNVLFAGFGPSGLGVLKDGTDTGDAISAEDISTCFGADKDAGGNVVPHTDWVEWKMHLGQRIKLDFPFNVGAGLNETLPGLGFHFDSTEGVRVDMRWDFRFGFGISQMPDQRLFLNSGATDEQLNPIQELRAQIVVSAAPPKDVQGREIFTDQRGLSGEIALGVLQAHVADGTRLPIAVTAPIGLKVNPLSPLQDYSNNFTVFLFDKDRDDRAYDIDYHSPPGGEDPLSLLVNLNTALFNATRLVYSDSPLPALSVTLDFEDVNGFADSSKPSTPAMKISARLPEITGMIVRRGAAYGFTEFGPDREQFDDRHQVGLGFDNNQASVLVGTDQVLLAKVLSPPIDLPLAQVPDFWLAIGGSRETQADGSVVTKGGKRIRITFPEELYDVEILEKRTTLDKTITEKIREELFLIGLDEHTVDVSLEDGKFKFVTHAHSGEPALLLTVYWDAKEKTEVTVAASVDIIDPSFNHVFFDENKQVTYNRLTILAGDLFDNHSELFTHPLTEIFNPVLEANAKLRLHVESDMELLSGAVEQALGLSHGAFGLPEVEFGFKFDAHAKVDFSKPAGERTEVEIDHIIFEDVRLDVGTLLESVAIPVANTFGGALGPVLEVIGSGLGGAQGFLNEPLPLLSDLGFGDISILDLSGNKDALNNLINTVQSIVSFVTGINDFVANYDGRPIAFGCFEYDLERKLLLPCEIAEMIDSTKEVGLEDFLSTATASFYKPGGFRLDLLTADPMPNSIINMLLGKPFDIVSLNLPHLGLFFGLKLGFNFDQLSFEVKIGADLHLGTAFKPLGIVYDSTGLAQIADAFRADVAPDWSDLLDGFYLRLDPDRAAPESPIGKELFLDLVIAGRGEVGPFPDTGPTIFHLKGDVGLHGTITLDLKDLNDDGKLRLGEIMELTDNFNDPAKLLCLFDAYVNFSGGFSFSITIAGATVSSDDLPFPTSFSVGIHLQAPARSWFPDME